MFNIFCVSVFQRCSWLINFIFTYNISSLNSLIPNMIMILAFKLFDEAASKLNQYDTIHIWTNCSIKIYRKWLNIQMKTLIALLNYDVKKY